MRFWLIPFSVLSIVKVGQALDKEYYLAAVEVDWEYAPIGRSVVKDPSGSASSFITQGPDRVGSRYKKAVYYQYTDETYTKRVYTPPWMGPLGPLIKGEVGDKLMVHFKNLASRAYSVHPHGVLYRKPSEGARYNDGTAVEDKQDDTVPPGGNHTYIWEITEEFGPAKDDPSCLPWAYHSHSEDVTKDTNTGLIGVLLTCKKGALDANDSRVDVDKEFVVLLKIVDENLSWYTKENLQKCEDPELCTKLSESNDEEFVESNLMHALNGYVYGNGPSFDACAGDKVAWYVIGMGSESDVHSFMVDGETMTYNGHRELTADVFAAKFISAEMTVVEEGWKLAYCGVNDHFGEGMQAFFNAQSCPDKEQAIFESDKVRQKFLMIREERWDYVPVGINKLTEKVFLDDNPESLYFIGKHNRIGSQYKKARFVDYEDRNFTRSSRVTVEEFHLGLMGPPIRVEVGDSLEVVVFNNATRPYSFYPHGLVPVGETEEADGLHTSPTLSNEMRTYRFYVPESAGPTASDPACVTYMYQSALDPVKDLNSGLFGPLLVCKPGALTEDSKQGGVGRDRTLFFGVIDENLSWYLEENINQYCIPAHVNKTNPHFIESNKMRGVNGQAFANLGGMELCRAERVSWHLFTMGDQEAVHSIYFHGMTFQLDGHLKDTVALVPGKSASFVTLMSHLGTWGIFDRNTDHFKAGLSVVYLVTDCQYLDPDLPSYSYLVEPFIRRYYIAAVQDDWDYAPSKTSVVDDSDLNDPASKGYVFSVHDDTHIGSVYRKVLYREYRDSSFMVPKHVSVDDDYLGLLGPVIRAEEGEVVEIVFKNLASRTYSIHSHLVQTNKANEGCLYSDKTDTKLDDGVPPGGYHVYRWEVIKGPGPKDPNCISSLYYSGHNQVKDPYSGLIGPIIICRKGILQNKWKRNDVDREFILLFSIFDENQSWFLEQNKRRFAASAKNDDPEFEESNLMHTVNGFIYQKLPGMTIHKGDNVSWHLLGYGGTHDIHTVHFHGQTVLKGQHTDDVITVFPETSESVTMVATNPGTWLLHCHINDHMDAGMTISYTILPHAKP